MALIFSKLEGFHSILAMVCVRLGVDVYYINLGSDNNELMSKRLNVKGILPLPIETLNNIDEWQHYINVNTNNDKENDWVLELLPDRVVASQKDLYQNIESINDKLRVALKTSVNTAVNGKVATYARVFSSNKHYFISTDIFELLLPIREENVRTLFIPSGVSLVRYIKKVFRKLVNKLKSKLNDIDLSKKDSFDISQVYDSKVAFVVHKGLSYGDLYQKDLFYSSKLDSPLSENNLLHISYSGVYPSQENIKWFYVFGRNSGWYAQVVAAINSLTRSLTTIRSIKHLLGVATMMVFYMRYVSYRKSMSTLSSLKLVLIDYEILCPKSLLLAFESLGIKTLAVQERYFMSYYKSFGTFLDYYMCSSDFSEDELKRNGSYMVKEYIPVGQYRSDTLAVHNTSDNVVLPSELEEAKKLKKKIIVALGFHTHLSDYQSITDPILSWSAHIAFIENILDLAKSIDNVFIVLRYKFIDWLNLPVFSDIVNKVKSTENVIISSEYSVKYYSYLLCSHADLIIAKHTSLGDECLSHGIPVLFHDYTHNLENIVSSVYDYEGSDIVCHDFNHLLTMAKDILYGEKNKYFDDIKHIYGSYGDGNVKNRIHEWLEKIFFELDERTNIQ